MTMRAPLQSYLLQLQANPLRTKMLTSGTLSGLQEILASWIAQDRNKDGHYFTSRVPKMAVYGALISAPLGHVLISILQRVFAGRTSLKAKLLQILASNLIVSPSSSAPRALLFCFSLSTPTRSPGSLSLSLSLSRKKPHTQAQAQKD